jgi:hypothetical protein
MPERCGCLPKLSNASVFADVVDVNAADCKKTTV